MTCRGNVKFTVDAVSCEKSVDGIGFAEGILISSCEVGTGNSCLQPQERR